LIGLLGGMSWESTELYYRLLNQGMNRALGGHHNARSLLATLDFQPLLEWGTSGRWDLMGEAVAEAAAGLERAGAECILITSNTGHVVAGQVERSVTVPLLHIADATGKAITQAGLDRVALIGTRYVIDMPFYTERLRERHGLSLVLPDEDDKAELHRIIIDELTLGQFRPESRERVLAITERLAERGAQGVVVGCTELPILVAAQDFPIPAFDTTRLHVEEAIRHALA
jgi:aspartate racemase